MESGYEIMDFIIDQARTWLVRLTSGEMTQAELEAFQRWSNDDRVGLIFRRELANWRKLAVLRDALPCAPMDMSVASRPSGGGIDRS